MDDRDGVFSWCPLIFAVDKMLFSCMFTILGPKTFFKTISQIHLCPRECKWTNYSTYSGCVYRRDVKGEGDGEEEAYDYEILNIWLPYKRHCIITSSANTFADCKLHNLHESCSLQKCVNWSHRCLFSKMSLHRNNRKMVIAKGNGIYFDEIKIHSAFWILPENANFPFFCSYKWMTAFLNLRSVFLLYLWRIYAIFEKKWLDIFLPLQYVFESNSFMSTIIVNYGVNDLHMQ